MKINLIKFIILLILIFIIVANAHRLYPRNFGEVMGKEYLINNVTSIKITQISGIKTKDIYITNKDQITKTIEYLSNQTVRRIVTNWGSPYESNAENYYIDFYGNTTESSGWVSTIGDKYIICYTYKERVHRIAGNINPYKFTKDFDLDYFRELFIN